MTMAKQCLILGGFGEIGSAVAKEFESQGYEVWRSSRTSKSGAEKAVVLTGIGYEDDQSVSSLPQFDSVIWAQGVNRNDSITNFSGDAFGEVLDANLIFVVSTLELLLRKNKIIDGAKLGIISSIWQEAARVDKLSYSVSKAALGGLVRSVSTDLAHKNILVSAILPGVVDTEMTRKVLDEVQISSVKNKTGFHRLVDLKGLANVVFFLCSDQNTCITGQSIIADLGYTNVIQI